MDDGRGEAAIREMTDALVAAQTADEAVTAFLDHLGNALGLRTAWVFQLDARLHAFRPVANVHLPPALARDDALPLRAGTCDCQKQFRRGELREAANIVTCSRLDAATGDRCGLSCHASLPLRQGERVLGILNVAAPGPQPLDAQTLRTLEIAGRTLSVALDRAALWRATERRFTRLGQLMEGLPTLAQANTVEEVLGAGVRLGQSVTDAAVAAVVRPDGRIGPAARAHRSFGPKPAIPAATPISVPFAHARIPWDPAADTPWHWQVHGPRVFDRSRSGVVAALGPRVGTLVLESRQPDGLDEGDAEVAGRLAGHLRQALQTLEDRDREARAAVLEERQRIARDLHDRVNQRLFSAQLAVSSASSLLLAGRLPELSPSLDVARDQLRAAQEEMRALVHALRPDEGTAQGVDLRATLADLASSCQGMDGPRIETDLCDVPSLTAPEVRTALVHIASEALHNALRHARAEHIRLRLRRLGPDLELIVADDGVGLGAQTTGSGMGLGNMRSRAEGVCGSLHVESGMRVREGSGSRVGLRDRRGRLREPGTVVRAQIPWRGCP